MKTSRAELSLTTEANAVRRRPLKTCPKKPRREKCGQEIWVGTRLKLKALLTGLYNVIENRLLLKKTKNKNKKQKIKKKPKRGWFRSLDDVHVIYAALYTPDMATHGAPGLEPRPCCIS